MSDALRQSNTDKAASSMKPDSQKSYMEQGQDALKSAGDSVGATAQPDSQKSGTQKASDTVTGTGSNDKSMLDSAKDAVGMGQKK